MSYQRKGNKKNMLNPLPCDNLATFFLMAVGADSVVFFFEENPHSTCSENAWVDPRLT
jgi:hypothetical protein